MVFKFYYVPGSDMSSSYLNILQFGRDSGFGFGLHDPQFALEPTAAYHIVQCPTPCLQSLHITL